MIQPGALILVPFPYTDLRRAKLRPALVIHSNSCFKDVIVLPVTSRKRSEGQESLTADDLTEGMLPVDSYLQINKVATLDLQLVEMHVATIRPKKMKEILKAFKGQF